LQIDWFYILSIDNNDSFEHGVRFGECFVNSIEKDIRWGFGGLEYEVVVWQVLIGEQDQEWDG